MSKFGLMLAAVFALCALAASSAYASEFLAHPSNGTFPAPLSGKALNIQKFVTVKGTVECKGLKLLNSAATSLAQATQHATVDYEECKAFGLAASVTPVLYLFHANGSVDLLNHVTITAIGCTVLVKPKNGLEKVLYRNEGQVVLITGEVTGILSEGTGAACTYAEESNGTYSGISDVWLTNGGLLKWDA